MSTAGTTTITKTGTRLRGRSRPGDVRLWLADRAPAIGVVLAVVAVALWAISIPSIHPYHTGDAGLVTGLPVLWWVALVLVAASFSVQLIDSEPSRWPMLVSVLSLVVVLHATLPAAENVPRFDAAYYIAGFTDFVGRTGTTLPRLDARMSWYGLYAGAGMAARAMQIPTTWFLRWAPVFFEICYLFPIKALANATLRTNRARWAALGVFLAGNWIDQDYFSPQAVGLMIFLVIVLVAVRTMAARGDQFFPLDRAMHTRLYQRVTSLGIRVLRLPYGAVPGEAPPEESSPATRAVLLVLVLGLVTVEVITHQASPVALCLVLFALAVLGRTRLRTVWLFAGFVVFSWLSFAGKPYWQSHLAKVFGSVGQVGSTVSTSISGRAVASTFGRALVEGGRIGSSMVIWLAGFAGFYVMWRRGRSSWTLAILAVAPILIGGAVSYGGEIALRILLFSLAPLAVLTAGLIDEPKVRRGAARLMGLTFVILLALFPLNRFGNESFEAFPPGDYQAAVWVHTHVPVGSHILLFSRDEPLPFTDVGDYHQTELGVNVLDNVATLNDVLPRTAGYIFLTQSQYEDGTVYLGLPKGWMALFERHLSRLPYVRQVYETSTARVYYFSARPRSLQPFKSLTPKGRVQGQVPQAPGTTPSVGPRPAKPAPVAPKPKPVKPVPVPHKRPSTTTTTPPKTGVTTSTTTPQSSIQNAVTPTTTSKSSKTS